MHAALVLTAVVLAEPALPSLPATRYTPPAEETPPPDPMRVRWAVDLPVIGLSTAIWVGTGVASREIRWSGCGGCDPSAINALDRAVIGNHSVPARVVSDVGLYTMIAAPFVLSLGDALIQRARDRPAWRRRHLPAWGKEAVVLFEVLSVNLAVTNLVKLAVRRPRPYSYDADSPVGDPTLDEARLSFFSGHTSTAFALASAYAYLFQLRHPRSRWVAPVWVLGMSLASVTAVARVEAGKHFWTDVIVGAVAGTSVGLLVPALHRNTAPGAPRLAFAPTRAGSMLVLSGQF